MAGTTTLSRAKLRTLVLIGTVAVAGLALIYGSLGDGEDPQVAVAQERRIEAAKAASGDPAQIASMLRKQAEEARLAQAQQAARDEAERKLAMTRRDRGAAAAPDLAGGDSGAIDPVQRRALLDLGGSAGAGASAGGTDIDGYQARKLDAGQARRRARRDRIGATEWDDDTAGGSLQPTRQSDRFPPEASAAGAAAPGRNDDMAQLRQTLMQAALRDQAGGGAAPAPVGNRDSAWLKEQDGVGAKAPLRPVAARSPYMLREGATIPCELTRNVISDLAGIVECMVSRDVYDSIGQRHLLIPRGTFAKGPYNSEVVFGQQRILAAFSRMDFPSGAHIDLGAMQAADRSGASGLPADVDNHFWSQFGAGFLVAGIAGLVRSSDSGSGGQVVVQTGGSGNALQTAAGQVLVSVTNQILSRNQSIKPTLTGRKGDRIVIVVARDLELPPQITRGPAPVAPGDSL